MSEEKSSVQKMAEIMALLFYHISKEVIVLSEMKVKEP